MSKKEDFRKLSIDAQASMRKVALKLVKRGEKQSSVADVIGVSRQTISEWVSKNRRGDKYVIRGRPRGRKTGEHRIINDELINNGSNRQDFMIYPYEFLYCFLCVLEQGFIVSMGLPHFWLILLFCYIYGFGATPLE